MSDTWHGYILVRRHPALTNEEWRAVATKLYQALDRVAESPNPSERLHYRLSLDKNQVIIEASFDQANINIEDLARLAKWISDAVPRFSPVQVAANFRDYVTLLGGLGATWDESAAAARQYIAANIEDWDEDLG